mmetsp:Transcript_11617/g.27938  ORF Transcript_11617/g.27938 Transcript_11617/m.27938 type:complete len:264 (-) Transcript_11617:2628-3419(-)
MWITLSKSPERVQLPQRERRARNRVPKEESLPLRMRIHKLAAPRVAVQRADREVRITVQKTQLARTKAAVPKVLPKVLPQEAVLKVLPKVLPQAAVQRAVRKALTLHTLPSAQRGAVAPKAVQVKGAVAPKAVQAKGAVAPKEVQAKGEVAPKGVQVKAAQAKGAIVPREALHHFQFQVNQIQLTLWQVSLRRALLPVKTPFTLCQASRRIQYSLSQVKTLFTLSLVAPNIVLLPSRAAARNPAVAVPRARAHRKEAVVTVVA